VSEGPDDDWEQIEKDPDEDWELVEAAESE